MAGETVTPEPVAVASTVEKIGEPSKHIETESGSPGVESNEGKNNANSLKEEVMQSIAEVVEKPVVVSEKAENSKVKVEEVSKDSKTSEVTVNSEKESSKEEELKKEITDSSSNSNPLISETVREEDESHTRSEDKVSLSEKEAESSTTLTETVREDIPEQTAENETVKEDLLKRNEEKSDSKDSFDAVSDVKVESKDFKKLEDEKGAIEIPITEIAESPINPEVKSPSSSEVEDKEVKEEVAPKADALKKEEAAKDGEDPKPEATSNTKVGDDSLSSEVITTERSFELEKPVVKEEKEDVAKTETPTLVEMDKDSKVPKKESETVAEIAEESVKSEEVIAPAKEVVAEGVKDEVTKENALTLAEHDKDSEAPTKENIPHAELAEDLVKPETFVPENTADAQKLEAAAKDGEDPNTEIPTLVETGKESEVPKKESETVTEIAAESVKSEVISPAKEVVAEGVKDEVTKENDPTSAEHNKNSEAQKTENILSAELAQDLVKPETFVPENTADAPKFEEAAKDSEDPNKEAIPSTKVGDDSLSSEVITTERSFELETPLVKEEKEDVAKTETTLLETDKESEVPKKENETVAEIAEESVTSEEVIAPATSVAVEEVKDEVTKENAPTLAEHDKDSEAPTTENIPSAELADDLVKLETLVRENAADGPKFKEAAKYGEDPKTEEIPSTEVGDDSLSSEIITTERILELEKPLVKEEKEDVKKTEVPTLVETEKDREVPEKESETVAETAEESVISEDIIAPATEVVAEEVKDEVTKENAPNLAEHDKHSEAPSTKNIPSTDLAEDLVKPEAFVPENTPDAPKLEETAKDGEDPNTEIPTLVETDKESAVPKKESETVTEIAAESVKSEVISPAKEVVAEGVKDEVTKENAPISAEHNKDSEAPTTENILSAKLAQDLVKPETFVQENTADAPKFEEAVKDSEGPNTEAISSTEVGDDSLTSEVITTERSLELETPLVKEEKEDVAKTEIPTLVETEKESKVPKKENETVAKIAEESVKSEEVIAPATEVVAEEVKDEVPKENAPTLAEHDKDGETPTAENIPSAERAQDLVKPETFVPENTADAPKFMEAAKDGEHPKTEEIPSTEVGDDSLSSEIITIERSFDLEKPLVKEEKEDVKKTGVQTLVETEKDSKVPKKESETVVEIAEESVKSSEVIAPATEVVAEEVKDEVTKENAPNLAERDKDSVGPTTENIPSAELTEDLVKPEAFFPENTTDAQKLEEAAKDREDRKTEEIPNTEVGDDSVSLEVITTERSFELEKPVVQEEEKEDVAKTKIPTMEEAKKESAVPKKETETVAEIAEESVKSEEVIAPATEVVAEEVKDEVPKENAPTLAEHDKDSEAPTAENIPSTERVEELVKPETFVQENTVDAPKLEEAAKDGEDPKTEEIPSTKVGDGSLSSEVNTAERSFELEIPLVEEKKHVTKPEVPTLVETENDSEVPRKENETVVEIAEESVKSEEVIEPATEVVAEEVKDEVPKENAPTLTEHDKDNEAPTAENIPSAELAQDLVKPETFVPENTEAAKDSEHPKTDEIPSTEVGDDSLSSEIITIDRSFDLEKPRVKEEKEDVKKTGVQTLVETEKDSEVPKNESETVVEIAEESVKSSEVIVPATEVVAEDVKYEVAKENASTLPEHDKNSEAPATENIPNAELADDLVKPEAVVPENTADAPKLEEATKYREDPKTEEIPCTKVGDDSVSSEVITTERNFELEKPLVKEEKEDVAKPEVPTLVETEKDSEVPKNDSEIVAEIAEESVKSGEVIAPATEVAAEEVKDDFTKENALAEHDKDSEAPTRENIPSAELTEDLVKPEAFFPENTADAPKLEEAAKDREDPKTVESPSTKVGDDSVSSEVITTVRSFELEKPLFKGAKEDVAKPEVQTLVETEKDSEVPKKESGTVAEYAEELVKTEEDIAPATEVVAEEVKDEVTKENAQTSAEHDKDSEALATENIPSAELAEDLVKPETFVPEITADAPKLEAPKDGEDPKTEAIPSTKVRDDSVSSDVITTERSFELEKPVVQEEGKKDVAKTAIPTLVETAKESAVPKNDIEIVAEIAEESVKSSEVIAPATEVAADEVKDEVTKENAPTFAEHDKDSEDPTTENIPSAELSDDFLRPEAFVPENKADAPKLEEATKYREDPKTEEIPSTKVGDDSVSSEVITTERSFELKKPLVKEEKEDVAKPEVPTLVETKKDSEVPKKGSETVAEIAEESVKSGEVIAPATEVVADEVKDDFTKENAPTLAEHDKDIEAPTTENIPSPELSDDYVKPEAFVPENTADAPKLEEAANDREDPKTVESPSTKVGDDSVSSEVITTVRSFELEKPLFKEAKEDVAKPEVPTLVETEKDSEVPKKESGTVAEMAEELVKTEEDIAPATEVVAEEVKDEVTKENAPTFTEHDKDSEAPTTENILSAELADDFVKPEAFVPENKADAPKLEEAAKYREVPKTEEIPSTKVGDDSVSSEVITTERSFELEKPLVKEEKEDVAKTMIPILVETEKESTVPKAESEIVAEIAEESVKSGEVIAPATEVVAEEVKDDFTKENAPTLAEHDKDSEAPTTENISSAELSDDFVKPEAFVPENTADAPKLEETAKDREDPKTVESPSTKVGDDSVSSEVITTVRSFELEKPLFKEEKEEVAKPEVPTLVETEKDSEVPKKESETVAELAEESVKSSEVIAPATEVAAEEVKDEVTKENVSTFAEHDKDSEAPTIENILSAEFADDFVKPEAFVPGNKAEGPKLEEAAKDREDPKTVESPSTTVGDDSVSSEVITTVRSFELEKPLFKEEKEHVAKPEVPTLVETEKDSEVPKKESETVAEIAEELVKTEEVIAPATEVVAEEVKDEVTKENAQTLAEHDKDGEAPTTENIPSAELAEDLVKPETFVPENTADAPKLEAAKDGEDPKTEAIPSTKVRDDSVSSDVITTERSFELEKPVVQEEEKEDVAKTAIPTLVETEKESAVPKAESETVAEIAEEPTKTEEVIVPAKEVVAKEVKNEVDKENAPTLAEHDKDSEAPTTESIASAELAESLVKPETVVPENTVVVAEEAKDEVKETDDPKLVSTTKVREVQKEESVPRAELAENLVKSQAAAPEWTLVVVEGVKDEVKEIDAPKLAKTPKDSEAPKEGSVTRTESVEEPVKSEPVTTERIFEPENVVAKEEEKEVSKADAPNLEEAATDSITPEVKGSGSAEVAEDKSIDKPEVEEIAFTQDSEAVKEEENKEGAVETDVRSSTEKPEYGEEKRVVDSSKQEKEQSVTTTKHMEEPVKSEPVITARSFEPENVVAKEEEKEVSKADAPKLEAVAKDSGALEVKDGGSAELVEDKSIDKPEVEEIASIQDSEAVKEEEKKEGSVKTEVPSSTEKPEHGEEKTEEVSSKQEVPMKQHHKKSHNILSNVGSKVKQSIVKVKKVITGKSPNPKPVSSETKE